MSRDLRNFRYGDWDKAITKLLRVNGLFRDRRSKVVHDVSGAQHLLLYGEDMSAQRERVFNKRHILINPASPPELDHKQGGTWGRCDCQHNLQPLRKAEHRAKHNREIKSARV